MAALMWEQGYAATSPKDVLTRAGVGQGSMYHYFDGKRELANEALHSLASQYIGNAGILGEEAPPLDRIRRYLSQARPGLRGCRIGRLTQDPQVVEDSEMIGLVAAAFDAVAANWSRVIDEAIAAGELPTTTNSAQLTRTLMAVLQGGYVLARAYQDQQPMDDAIAGALALLDAASALAATADSPPPLLPVIPTPPAPPAGVPAHEASAPPTKTGNNT